MKKKLVFALFCALTGLAMSVEAQTTNTNTVVRFRFAYAGTRFGDVDVELFADKPVTVSNFLAYVQSGRYDNSLLTRCIAGFVLQGGEYTVANPFTDAPFELVTRVPTFADITNEFAVGTLRSNVLGTLAMAKVDGNPNSANSSWFFNLGNNAVGSSLTNLDLQNGGFTVFGKVKTGMNVLTTFNKFSLYNGILNLADGFTFFNCPELFKAGDPLSITFDTLPVAYRGQFCPVYSDLFTVQITQVSGTDLVSPKLTVILPAANGTTTNSQVLVTGTATDSVGVSNVRVYLNTNGPIVADGSNSWSVTVTNLPPGTNTIDIEASDIAGNRSRVSRTFFNSVRVPLTLLTTGAGAILGATNGQPLELTRPYTLTARPDPANLFGGWTGSFNEVSTTLNFHMETNLAFTAVFASNRFPYVKGVYNGLFYETNQVQQRSSGYLTLTLGDLGAYSGKLLMNGRTFRVAGAFGIDGGETNTVLLSEFDNIRLLLRVDLTGGSNQITGQITNRAWVSELAMDRAVFHATTNPAALAGIYTFIIPVDTNGVPGPEGESFATLKVDTKGGVTIKGMLSDNTPLSLKTTLSKDGAVPVYAALYKGLGALVGWVMFDTNQPSTDFSGLINWFKQSQVYAKHYGRGFTNEMLLQGSRYVPPTTNRVLNLTNAIVGFTNGNQAADFANEVVLGADNKILNSSTNKLTLTLTKSSGLFSGTVTAPGSTRSLPFKGAVLQKQNRGAGFLAGSNKTTQVRLDAAPSP